MKVHLTGPHGYASVHNEKDLTLAAFLEGKGWELVGSPHEADAICAVELPVNRFHTPKAVPFSEKKGLLIIQEPSVVRPFHGRERYINRFAKKLEVGRIRSSGVTRWPALYLDRFQENSKINKLPRACMIASNKLSLIPGELYSLRRAVVDDNLNVDLYGAGWRAGKLQRIKQCTFELYIGILSGHLSVTKGMVRFFSNVRQDFGAVEDKLSTNSNYKVTVVIENSIEYMSEKLLEAIAAGSIPVYVGPPVRNFGIPAELVIQVNPDLQSVHEGVSKALQLDYESWETSCKSWLSPATRDLWSLEGFWGRIHDELTNLANS
jgi:hypothetical protein